MAYIMGVILPIIFQVKCLPKKCHRFHPGRSNMLNLKMMVPLKRYPVAFCRALGSVTYHTAELISHISTKLDDYGQSSIVCDVFTWRVMRMTSRELIMPPRLPPKEKSLGARIPKWQCPKSGLFRPAERKEGALIQLFLRQALTSILNLQSRLCFGNLLRHWKLQTSEHDIFHCHYAHLWQLYSGRAYTHFRNHWVGCRGILHIS